MDLQHDLEVKTEAAAKEAAKTGMKVFAFAVKAEAAMIKGAFNIATFIPKHILEGLCDKNKEYKGKQSIKTLVGSGAKLENIPIDKDKLGDFESVARQYGVDYSFKKAVEDSGKEQYYIFFKAKDITVLTAAFKEFSAKLVDNERKKSINERLREDRQAKRTQNRERKREKKKTREAEL